jgi:hypothetical protein
MFASWKNGQPALDRSAWLRPHTALDPHRVRDALRLYGWVARRTGCRRPDRLYEQQICSLRFRVQLVEGRRDSHGGVRGRPPAHRPLDRLNCRSSPGRRARAHSRRDALHADRARRAGRHLRALCVRGHAPRGGEVRRHGLDDPSDQTGRLTRSSSSPSNRSSPTRVRLRGLPREMPYEAEA